MLLFKDYFSFKKENKLLLKLVNDTEAYNVDLKPVLFVLDILSELKENDKDLDFDTVINIFESGFGYLKIYLNYINLFIMENDITIATEMADHIAFYIEISTYLSYLHNEYEKLHGLKDLDEFSDIVEDMIKDRTKSDLTKLRNTFVTLLNDIETKNKIEIPTEELFIPGAFEILYEEIVNEETFDF